MIQRLIKIYRLINKIRWEIWIIVGITASLVLDALPCEYWSAVKWIFVREEDEFTGIAAMILVVWTFTTSLVIFWIGHMDDKRYGIRLLDLFIQGLYPSGYKRLVVMGGALVFELAAIFWTTFYKREISLVVITGMQIFIMVYMFLMICVESSQTNIREQIKRQAVDYIQQNTEDGNGINQFLVKMIDYTNYKDESEISQLKDMLEDIEEDINKNVREKTSPEKNKLQKSMQQFMSSCTDYMIKACNDRETITNIVNILMDESQSVFTKVGIFLSVMENEYRKNAPSVRDIAEVEFQGRKEVIATGLAYSGYYSSQKNDMNYLKMARGVYKYLWKKMGDDELKIIFNTWRNLYKEKSENSEDGLFYWNLDKLWEIISLGKEHRYGKRFADFNFI